VRRKFALTFLNPSDIFDAEYSSGFGSIGMGKDH
jgi:hypothetical protein